MKLFHKRHKLLPGLPGYINDLSISLSWKKSHSRLYAFYKIWMNEINHELLSDSTLIDQTSLNNGTIFFFSFNIVVLLSWNQVHLRTHWNHTHDQNRVKNCIFVSCNDCSLILVAFYFIFCSIFLRISSCITPQLRAKFIRQLTMIACAAIFFLFFCILALFFWRQNLKICAQYSWNSWKGRAELFF